MVILEAIIMGVSCAATYKFLGFMSTIIKNIITLIAENTQAKRKQENK